ncbi:PTS system mannose-specific EIIAB component [Companilactobacillus paralimentarius]
MEIDPSNLHKTNIKRQVTKESSKKTSNKDPIINVRIDARLIHGQVATMWTSSLSASRIMVIDDNIVKSNVQKMTLKTAVPGGVHLSILTTDGAARRIKENQYAGQRVFIIVRDPAVLSKLTDDGVKLKDINVGNISMKQGARQVAKSVAVTEEDVKVFNDLNSKGINLYHQMVPNDKKQNFMKLLDKGE